MDLNGGGGMTKNALWRVENLDFRQGIYELEDDFTIITDPPYNINYEYNEYNDNLNDEEYIELISNFKGLKIAIIHYP